MRFPVLAAMPVLLGLAACSAGPDTYAAMTTGVGFGDYQRYLRERDSAAGLHAAPFSVPPESRAAPILPPASMPAAAPTTLDTVPLRSLPPVTLAAAPPPPPVTVQPLPAPVVGAPLAAPMAAPMTAAPLTAAPLPAPSAPVTTAGAVFGTTPAFDAGGPVTPTVSDEQDFNAVSARETIESDRERLARQRAQYQIIEVTSVPTGSQSAGPDIVAFALSVDHAPGTEVYRRINPLRWSRWEAACLQFRNQEAAQEAFLMAGGPDRDRENLDPDGDGYACWWDPTPLRQALARQ